MLWWMYMIYYIKLCLRFDFVDGTYLLSTADYGMSGYFDENAYKSLIQLSVKEIEEATNKEVKDCYTISIDESEEDTSKEKDVLILLEDDKG